MRRTPLGPTDASRNAVTVNDRGESWVGFTRAWASLFGPDGERTATVPLPATPMALVETNSSDLVALCKAKRDVWGRRMTALQAVSVGRDGTTHSSVEPPGSFGWCRALADDNDRVLLLSDRSVVELVSGVATVVLPWYRYAIALEPNSGEVWTIDHVSASKLDECSAFARRATKDPFAIATAWVNGRLLRGFAPRADAQVWVAYSPAFGAAPGLVRRYPSVLPPIKAPHVPTCELVIDSEIDQIISARDGGFWLLLRTGAVQRYDADAKLVHELALAEKPDTLSGLVLSRRERFMAAIDRSANSLIQVDLEAEA